MTDGRDWPNRAASRFVQAGKMRWHVQRAGEGPELLLIHGTGASTHSWAGLLPLLAARYRVTALDLPGHGFTDPLAGVPGLPAMARAVAELLAVLEVRPTVGVGHSAGAAILARMVLDGSIAPHHLFSLGGALLPLGGPAWFAPVGRWIGGSRILPRLFAFHAADRRTVDRLLRGTGSAVPADSAAIYARLARRAGHAAGALGMMANWDLETLRADLPRLGGRLILLHGGNDRLIAPATAEAVRALVPGAVVVPLPGLGHLAHEEQPAMIARLIMERDA